ncbi:MAG: putative transporter [Prevotella bivia]|uniref:Transporter n=1 Tax=Prevotella bivia DNF00320 TaxID=1401068 RepID=A0A096BR03_9BACT|nr:putative transporter [Prevotella bivia]KGF23044.1 transporter [Prevotella bivia DNF00188]KGF45112.1 transporter [Prevotella bivia DNF00320]MDU2113159.1 putative transporter [Prevotella bivia]MDU2329230.1 putative transporter [Prevotella bivia]MDU3908788.1 putative transporter [Prevotella bivia]
MDWLINLFTNEESIAHIVLLYSIVIAAGIYLGKIKVGGISLGVTFVLFAGIVAGHVGFTGPLSTLTFLQDFGLILFVFMIGLQVGPGFFESFGKGGIKLNALSAVAILLNILVMFGCYYIFFDTSNPNNLPMMVGTLYGAVTNTPGLGAAKEALSSVFTTTHNFDIASGYACAYPLGVVGIISATLAIKYICRVDLDDENKKLLAEEGESPDAKPHIMYLKVSNAYIAGRTMEEITQFLNRDMVCTRIMHNGEITVPTRNTNFEEGDEILVVCAEMDASAIQAFIGPEIEVNWHEEKQQQRLISKQILVTRGAMNGKMLGKIPFNAVYGVNITRITRQGMELFASSSHIFNVGDRITVVGTEENVARVAEMVGNSEKVLNHPNLATIFIGIMVGLLFGSLPLAIPGMPVPLKLGLAGGPLIIAIFIGRFGYRMHLVTYTTTSANMMLREFGLALFLASVGIKAGHGFWDTVVQGDGLKYVYTGFLITIIPILIIGTIARKKYKFNYFTIMGMLAGTYTDPPALAYANSVCTGEAPAIGYSTVYPLSMFLRILTAQLVVLFFCGA